MNRNYFWLLFLMKWFVKRRIIGRERMFMAPRIPKFIMKERFLMCDLL